MEEFTKFKEEVHSHLKNISDTQNEIKKELFIIRNKQEEHKSAHAIPDVVQDKHYVPQKEVLRSTKRTEPVVIVPLS